MKLTELSIKRPAFMAMVFVALAVFGIYSFSNMGEDLLPKMDFPMVFVATPYPGAGPEEIETQVGKPIEEALSSINGIKSIRTFCAENFNFCMIEFNMTENVDVALNNVERQVSAVQNQLPDGVKPSTVNKADIGAFAILRIATQSNMQPEAFYQFIKDHVKPQLEQVDGVSGVEIVGGKQREIRVEVDNEKLRHYNLTLAQINNALTLENLDFPTGSVEQRDRRFIVRVAGKFKILEEIGNLIVSSGPNGSVYLKDVANILDTDKEDFTFGRLNNVNSIGLLITKASDANAVKTSDGVQKAMKKMEGLYKQHNLKFVVAQDITDFTRRAVKSVEIDMLFAIFMVAFVLFIFLHNAKNMFIVLLTIPISLVTTFIMMKLMNFTINLITMMAMTLVIGILVDDSIVVLENIHRKLQLGRDKVTAAIEGRYEIGLAAIAITLVDVVVFLPIAMLSGMVGMIFREFGLTIVTATLVSLFVSFTLTPLLASRWSEVITCSNKDLLSRFTCAFENFEEKMRKGYRNLLESCLRHRWRVVLVAAFALVLSFVLVGTGFVGGEFMPNMDRGEFAVNLELPKGTGIIENDMITKRVERVIAASTEVATYYTVVGRKEQPWGGSNSPDISQIQVKLKPIKERRPTNDVINSLLTDIGKIPGVKASAAMIGLFGAAEESSLMLELKGDNLESLVKTSETVLNIVKQVPGTRDVKTSWETGQPEVQVHIDREKCAYYKTTVGEVGQTVRNALQGDIPSKFKDGPTEYDINVILDKKYRQDAENVKKIMIMNHESKPILLSQVADVGYGIGPTVISRKDRTRVISITMNATIPSNAIRQGIEKGLAKVTLPPEVSVFYAGDFESQTDMMKDMMMAIGFAFLFVYMIMVSLFESFTYPFIIMFSIPVALVGALFALALTHQTLNVFSMIGIIMSMGLVTKNAILLVDYTNTLRRRGKDMVSALLEAGPIRLRPIIMTTLTMVFGMMPIALSGGSGADMRKGMAIVVIGALISSTMLTLVLVPTVYSIMESIRRRLGLIKENEFIPTEEDLKQMAE
jgi:hydrophobic/amphiphilic exporter-1 (mainly G- bacteria), HAE1 family